MKTVSTKLDKQTFEKFLEICENNGQCMSERLRDSIMMEIKAYAEELEKEKGQKASQENQSRPVAKVIRISYDGKIWHDLSL